MNYFELLPSLISGREEVFHLALEGKARHITFINVTILGILLGVSNLFGALQLNPTLPMEGKFALITPMLFAVLGIFHILGALAGFCMIYWSAAKAFGGPAGFGLVLDLIGITAIPFWILAPTLNYNLRFRESESLSMIALLPIILAFAWSFKLIRQSLISGQGLSVGKATLAVACMWIFSISSIYVFLP